VWCCADCEHLPARGLERATSAALNGSSQSKHKSSSGSSSKNSGSGKSSGGAHGSLPAGCSARRPPRAQRGPHACERCGGRFGSCAGLYGYRTNDGRWLPGPSADLAHAPESPNRRWCCWQCEAPHAAASASAPPLEGLEGLKRMAALLPGDRAKFTGRFQQVPKQRARRGAAAPAVAIAHNEPLPAGNPCLPECVSKIK
jgi:hypothetical protein